ncbi:MAG: toprim domain-containing protein [Candidatus Riflebacteria bacterium]|nr:toprim domain-containing protein [Candidatus Riflebacteria bacterium]
MPRIPTEEIERLKQEMSVQQLAEARGIKLNPHGKDLLGLCPFHEDHEPSLVITPSKNLWNCLGACGSGGTVIDWVMKAEGVSFRHAVEILREGTISNTQPTGKRIKIATVPKLPPPVDFKAEEQELLKQAVEYYHQTLKQSPEALSYLEKRGLKNSEMIDHFKIGCANRTFGFRLPDKNRQAGAAIREKLTKLGILRNTGHEHFNGSVVFPIFDEHGQITEIYGRKIRDDLREGTAYHLYLPGPHKGVFNLEALKASKEIILCEAIIDALTFWCAGFRNVTAAYGVNGFTPDHLAAFKQYGVEKVFIAYDRDTAGNKAADELASQLIGEGFECFRVLFPSEMDANEYALKAKSPEKSLDVAIRNARWIGKGKPNTVQQLKTLEPKAATKKESFQPPAVDNQQNKPAEEPQNPEMLSQPSKEEVNIFPLAAKEENLEKLEPVQAAAAPQRVEILTEIKPEEIIIKLDGRRCEFAGY